MQKSSSGGDPGATPAATLDAPDLPHPCPAPTGAARPGVATRLACRLTSHEKDTLMLHNDFTAKALVEDRHRELRYRAAPRSRPKAPPRRWTRPGRR